MDAPRPKHTATTRALCRHKVDQGNARGRAKWGSRWAPEVLPCDLPCGYCLAEAAHWALVAGLELEDE